MIQATTTEKQKTISVKRTLNLPLTSVWKAFTEPESMKKWWGPEEYTCPDCAIDFNVGGKFLASMQGLDGNKIWSTGTYREIEVLKKIVNTDSFSDSNGNIVPASHYNMPGEWDPEALVTIELEAVDGQTNLSLTHAGLPVEITDECMKGWQSSFDKLERNVK